MYRRACCIAKIAANASTYSLTTLAGLEAVFLDLPTRKELTIHVVGGDSMDFGALRMTEDFLHLLPN